MKSDKENYTALVFIGKCATELEQYDQAKQAYNKAIGVNNEQLLAWQVKIFVDLLKKKYWYRIFVENTKSSQESKPSLRRCNNVM